MVAIKYFGMPSCCANCDMCLSCALDEGLCHITQHTIGNIYDERPSDCPLVEIEERKQGEWKSLKGEYGIDYVKCSCCNLNSIDQRAYAPMNYCPNCGAEMTPRNECRED